MSRRGRLSTTELEQLEYHSLGVKPDVDDQRSSDMDDLLQIERARLVERHEAEVSALKADGDRLRADVSREKRRVDWLYLALFGAILVILYLYGNAVRCKL